MYYLGEAGRDLLCRHPAGSTHKGIVLHHPKPLPGRQKAGYPRGHSPGIQNGKACLPQAGIQGIQSNRVLFWIYETIKEIKVVGNMFLEIISGENAGEAGRRLLRMMN